MSISSPSVFFGMWLSGIPCCILCGYSAWMTKRRRLAGIKEGQPAGHLVKAFWQEYAPLVGVALAIWFIGVIFLAQLFFGFKLLGVIRY